MKRALYWSLTCSVLATAFVAFHLAGWLIAGLALIVNGIAESLYAAAQWVLRRGQALKRWSRS